MSKVLKLSRCAKCSKLKNIIKYKLGSNVCFECSNELDEGSTENTPVKAPKVYSETYTAIASRKHRAKNRDRINKRRREIYAKKK